MCARALLYLHRPTSIYVYIDLNGSFARLKSEFTAFHLSPGISRHCVSERSLTVSPVQRPQFSPTLRKKSPTPSLWIGNRQKRRDKANYYRYGR